MSVFASADEEFVSNIESDPSEQLVCASTNRNVVLKWKSSTEEVNSMEIKN